MTENKNEENGSPRYGVTLSRSAKGDVYWDVVVMNARTWQQAVAEARDADAELQKAYARRAV